MIRGEHNHLSPEFVSSYVVKFGQHRQLIKVRGSLKL